MTRVGATIACAVLLGCPGGSDGDQGSAQGGGTEAPGPTAGSSTRLCDAHLSWDMGCAALEPEPREDPYWGATECRSGPWRYLQAAYLDAAVACFETLPCEASDDECTAQGLSALGIESADDIAGDALVQQCMDLASSCEPLSDDACLFFAVYTPQAREQAAACLELACDAIEPCLLDPG